MLCDNTPGGFSCPQPESVQRLYMRILQVLYRFRPECHFMVRLSFLIQHTHVEKLTEQPPPPRCISQYHLGFSCSLKQVPLMENIQYPAFHEVTTAIMRVYLRM